MSDFADDAAAREQLFRDESLEAHRRRNRPTGTSPKTCVSCGDEIEPARREIMPGTNICGSCAQDLAG